MRPPFGLAATAVAATVLAALLLVGVVAGGGDPVVLPVAGPAGEPGEGLWAARAGAPPGAYAAALAQAGEVPESPVTSLHGWRDRGPSRIGGRLTDLALAPDGRLYAAAASGGLWASDDGGRTLTPTWPADATPAIGAVAVTAEGVVLVGTGEANAGGGSVTYGGTGVYRSTDGGATWDHVGLATSGTVARIVPHPSDPAVVYLAAGGDLFTGGGERGIYRSDDAGGTWTRVLAPSTPTAGGADIAIDPSDHDHLLAALWDRQRTPAERRYGGPGSGLHRSTDGGTTWTPVDGGLPGFAADSGRIAVAFSPADPTRVYAVVTRGDGRAGGLWRADDGGTTWARVDDSPLYEPSQHIFGWWFSKVFPAPDDRDRVLVPGLTLLESVDGGVTFSSDGLVHADQHDLIWDPRDPSTAHLATDGGLYTSDQAGRSLTWEPAVEQGFTQLYRVASAPGADPDRALAAGFQDLGCMLTEGAADDWYPSAGCGDGTAVLVHPDRPSEVVLCGQYGRCRRSADFGRTTQRMDLPDVDRVAWAPPLIALPGAPDRLVWAGSTVHRSDDGGRTWVQVSDDLTRGEAPDPDYPFGTVSALAAGDAEGRLLVAGTDDGLVWRTDDGGGTWAQVADVGRWVTGLALVDGGDRLVVTTSGYLAGDDAPQVLVVADPDVTAIGAGLPAAPVNDVVVLDDGTVVVATDVGVFTAVDVDAPVWRRVGTALPQAPVLDLDWSGDRRELTVATYGRGAWTATIPSLSRHAGDDRYATAAAIAQVHDGAAGGPVDEVVLASGEDFPDALTAAARVAASPSRRLVLTRRDDLPGPSADLLAAWAPERLVVVGGEAAVSADVVAQAAAAGGDPAVTRLAGAGRYATAAAVATAGGGAGDAVVLATAGTPFDALAGAALAADVDAPVLLVDPDRLPAATAQVLADLAPSTVIALGGPAAIGDAVLAEAGTVAGAVTRRIAGPDRIATAAAITGELGEGPEVWLATAAGFPDSLAAAATGSPVLLTDPSGLSSGVLDALAARRPIAVRIAGGPAAVADDVVTALRTGPG